MKWKIQLSEEHPATVRGIVREGGNIPAEAPRLRRPAGAKRGDVITWDREKKMELFGDSHPEGIQKKRSPCPLNGLPTKGTDTSFKWLGCRSGLRKGGEQ